MAMHLHKGLLVLLLATCAATAPAGKLKEFAQQATGKEEPAPPPAKEKPKAYATSATESFGTGTYPSETGGQSFLGGFYAWLVAGPLAYRHDDPAGSLRDGQDAADGPLGFFPRHLPGEATVPYARFDYNWQHVDGDIDADDVRVELGYKPFAVHLRTTRYADASDGFELDIDQVYGVLRYGGYRPDFLPGTFEAGLGLGASRIGTNDSSSSDESGIAFTIPLKYYPAEFFGIEFRPAWYTWFEDRRVGDYDLSASVGWRFVQVRGGYRWMTLSGKTWNDGPYAGFSASF